jgi:hypothetical protein
MIDNLLPYALIKQANPVFDYEERRMRWPLNEEGMKRFSFNVLGSVATFAGVIWCLLLGASANGRYYGFSSTLSIFFLLLMFGTFAVMVSADFYYTIVTVGSTVRHLSSGQWDMLRMTTQREENIFAAKVAIAQIRGWRFMVIEIALRLISAEMLLIAYITPLFMGDAGVTLRNYFLMYLGSAVALLIFSAVYVVEPLWRMRTITAIGLAAAARLRSVTFAVLAGLGAVLVLRIAQLIMLVIAWMGMFVFLRSDGLSYSCVFPMVCTGLAVAFWGSYKTLRSIASRYAFRKMFEAEGV